MSGLDLEKLMRIEFPHPVVRATVRRLLAQERLMQRSSCWRRWTSLGAGRMSDIDAISSPEEMVSFGSVQVLEVYAGCDGLPRTSLPHGSFARLAWSGDWCVPLKPEFATDILKRSGRAPHLLDASSVADIVGDCLTNKNLVTDDVLDEGWESLLNFGARLGGFGGGYEVAHGRVGQFQTVIRAPSMKELDGDLVEFVWFAVRGWMHEKVSLLKRRLIVTGDGNIQQFGTELLCRKPFRKMPGIIY